jgi:hypothetical protein
MRSLLGGIALWVALWAPSGASEAPDPPPRDAKSWGLLIEAARARGGAETRLDKSSSYVFQQENGDYVTLTEWRSTPPKRFVCTIARNQKATVCARWETGQTTYGERADAASPWKTRVAKRLEDTPATTPEGDLLRSVFDYILGGSPSDEYFIMRRP